MKNDFYHIVKRQSIETIFLVSSRLLVESFPKRN